MDPGSDLDWMDHHSPIGADAQIDALTVGPELRWESQCGGFDASENTGEVGVERYRDRKGDCALMGVW